MKTNKDLTINLIRPEESEVKFELTTFPDGEPHIKFEELNRKKSYAVICRITNPSELFVLMQVGNILNRQGVEFDLIITYLMSMRMDRVINFEEAFSLEIVANMINNLHADNVYIFEAHSDRTFALINNSKPYTYLGGPKLEYKMDVICYPDAGACQRYKHNYKAFGSIVLEKKRDLKNKGQIISLDIVEEPIEVYDYQRIVIFDDLCDAGGTFVWSAKILREYYPNNKLCIYVKHLVNPIGLKNLAENFDEVHITDSYKDWDISEYNNVTVHMLF